MMKNLLDIFNHLRTAPKKNFDAYTDDYFTNEDLPPQSEVRNFVGLAVWKYISDTISYRIRAIRDDLEDQNVDIETIRVQQGRVEELRFIIGLPNFILKNYDNLIAEISAVKKAEEPNKR